MCLSGEACTPYNLWLVQLVHCDHLLKITYSTTGCL